MKIFVLLVIGLLSGFVFVHNQRSAKERADLKLWKSFLRKKASEKTDDWTGF